MSNAGDGLEIDLASRMQAIAEEDAPLPFPRSPTDEYRKRPVTIQAVQFGLAEYADVPHAAWRAPVPLAWLDAALRDDYVTFEFLSEDYWYFNVRTLEGVMRGGPDDWLIRGVEGELYPCADRIFRATYEPVA